ncbi:flavodoxin-dependent (E)-4-hydroxy-3-methylbut-2-enyl-diphosphate synthase [Acidithiobacillus sp.]|uniref:flavodoxin-dependent (E)-4-hydroxy-3-methylbut-2-enyl-diphosphate synthase n=1 Tax=Acidithiobacillus sp. TaxID=1872118 RepID=UPI003D04AE2D
MHHESPIRRRKTRQIHVGKVAIGGDAPISVQSMTNTETRDIAATVAQIRRLEAVGADIVRISVPSMDAAEAFKTIRAQVETPLVADIHFDHRIALQVMEDGVDGLRINPGNIGSLDKTRLVVEMARDKGIPIRIGVNAGSLEKDIQEKYGEPTPEALVESALRHVSILDELNFHDVKISVKASDIFLAVSAYRLLSEKVDYPLHLGITEAGGLRSGTVKSAIGLGLLLRDGIGDTIRVSLAADPVEEIRVGFDILKSLHLRQKGINLIACPSCSRQEFDVITTINALEARLEDILEPMDISVIGCVVNGIGEAKEADIGLAGGDKRSILYYRGKQVDRVENSDIVDVLEKRIRAEIAERQAARHEVEHHLPVLQSGSGHGE